MKRVVVLGSGGMLGHALAAFLSRRGHSVLPLARAAFDAAGPLAALESHLAGADAVVNCAAILHSRIASVPVEQVLRVNSVFPHELARLCARWSLACIQPGTDGVFAGTSGGYDEQSPVDAADLYGLSKAAGESAEAMVLRTSLVGEEQGTHRSLLEWARLQRGGEVRGFVNQRWNGITTVQMSEVIAALLEEDGWRPGIFHLHSPEAVSKCDLLRLISAAYGLDLKVTEAEAAQASDRTLRSSRDLARRHCAKPIAQQLEEMRRFFQGQ